MHPWRKQRWPTSKSVRVGIKISRNTYSVGWRVDGARNKEFICLREQRVSLSICLSTVSTLFTMLVAAESPKLCNEKLHDTNARAEMDHCISRCVDLPTISLFQAAVYQISQFQQSQVSSANRSFRISMCMPKFFLLGN
jgi:hypothetical protein